MTTTDTHGSRHWHRLAFGALGVLALGATAGASRPSFQDLKMDGYPAPGAPPIVTVLSTGGAPRTALRYTPPNGYKDHMSMNLQMSMSMDMAGMALPAMDMPAMKFGADLNVTGVNASGDISYEMAFSGIDMQMPADANPAMAGALPGLDADYKTLKGSGTITNRGINRATNFDFSKISSPQLKQAFDSISNTLQNLSMPLPEEAVGIGARWEVRQAVTSGGLQSFTKTVYEVTARDGKIVTLKSTVEQTAPAQPVSNPAFPAGVQAQLQKMTGAGSGTITLHLDALVPTSEATLQSDTVMQINMGGDSQTISTGITIKVAVSPVK